MQFFFLIDCLREQSFTLSPTLTKFVTPREGLGRYYRTDDRPSEPVTLLSLKLCYIKF